MFVYWADLAKSKNSRVFARRKKGTSIPEDLQWGVQNSASEIDWRSSLLLNLVLQTQYSLTVMRCDPWEVDRLLEHPSWGGAQNSATYRHSMRSRRHVRVTKIVHASPSTTPVNLDQSKAMDEAPAISYPDICFAVDDFVEVFECLTLDQSTDCYCVVLHADVEASWKPAICLKEPAEQPAEEINEESKEERREKEEPKEDDLTSVLERLTLGRNRGQQSQHAARAEQDKDALRGAVVFNGYVSCRQLCKALRPQLESPLRALQSNSHRVLMRGPGGVGSADVAVTHIRSALPEGTQAKTSQFFMPRAFRVAQNVVRGVVEAARAASFSGGSIEDVKLQCALMSLAVPVEALAEEILKAI